MNQIDDKRKNSKFFFLILSCSGGAGHIRAAEALHRMAQFLNYPIYTKHFDILELTPKVFKRLYSETYIQLVNRAPELWGYLYQQSEQKPYEKTPFIKAFDKLNYKKYLKTILSLKPDALICTHFLPYISISSQFQNKNYNIPIFSVTTDFDVHQLWIDPIVERYFVFHEETAWQLQSKYVPINRIETTGIPIMPEFSKKEKSNLVRTKLELHQKGFTILILSGGFGIGRVQNIVEHTINTISFFPTKKFNLIIVCGRNEKAKSDINKIQFPQNAHVNIFGFVDNIHQLMDASDIVITKAGGLTSSEALAKSLPMLIIDPIPGQESRNTDLIVEHGAGWKAINLANLSFKLKQILEKPYLLNNAKKASKSLAKPDAAKKILKSIYNFMETRRS